MVFHASQNKSCGLGIFQNAKNEKLKNSSKTEMDHDVLFDIIVDIFNSDVVVHTALLQLSGLMVMHTSQSTFTKC